MLLGRVYEEPSKLLEAGKNPIVHYVFSHWHRISPSKDIEKKIAKCTEPSYLSYLNIEIILLNLFQLVLNINAISY